MIIYCDGHDDDDEGDDNDDNDSVDGWLLCDIPACFLTKTPVWGLAHVS